MKKILILLSLIGLDAHLLGQETNVDYKWAFAPSFSIDYDYRTMVNRDQSEISKAIIALREEFEEPKTGFTSGLNISRNLGKRFVLETGVLYAVKGYQMKRDWIYGDSLDPLIPAEQSTFFQKHFLDVPIKLGVRLGKAKWCFVPAAGLALNVYLRTINVDVNDFGTGSIEYTRSKSNEPIFPLTYSWLISAGLQYHFSERVTWHVEPIYRRSMIWVSDTPVSEYLWNPGLNLAYYYRF